MEVMYEIKTLKTKIFYKYLIGQKKVKPIFIQRWEEYQTLKSNFTKKRVGMDL